MKPFLVFILIFFGFSGFSQNGKNNLQIELSTNWLIISNHTVFKNLPGSSSAQNLVKSNTFITEKIGISLRSLYNIPVMGNISAAAGLSFDYFALAIKHSEYPVYNPTNSGSDLLLYIDEPVNKINIVYMGIPILGKYAFLENKLKLQLGFVTNFLLFNRQKLITNQLEGGVITQTIKNTSKGLYKIGASLETGINYEVIENLGVVLRYQRAFTPIFENGYWGLETMYYNVFNLGVYYNIL